MKLERVFSASSWKDSPDSWYRSPANMLPTPELFARRLLSLAKLVPPLLHV